MYNLSAKNLLQIKQKQNPTSFQLQERTTFKLFKNLVQKEN